MLQYVGPTLAALSFLQQQSAPPQAGRAMQPSPGNPNASMQFMPKIPMAGYNPNQMGAELIDEEMLMNFAPPRGLLY